jgi:hypothetical protein
MLAAYYFRLVILNGQAPVVMVSLRCTIPFKMRGTDVMPNCRGFTHSRLCARLANRYIAAGAAPPLYNYWQIGSLFTDMKIT